MMRDEQPSILIKTFAIVWPYIIVMSALAFVVFDFILGFEESIAISYFLGAIVSVMLWSMTYKSTFKTANAMPEKLKSLSIRNYIIRFLFYALILTIAQLSDNLEIIATFVGFTSFKVALIISSIIYKGSESDA